MTEEPIKLYDTEPGIKAYSTRRGIAAEEWSEPYAGLSICGYTGDTQEHIEQSLKLLSEHIGISDAELVTAVQRHTANVALITENNRFETFENVDALVTAEAGITLGVFTADCLPLLMYDRKAGVIAACHCGWRGTVGGIARATIATMEQAGAVREHIHAITGPCICAECFEVGEEVAELFPASCVDSSRRHVDLRKAVELQLREEGVSAENIISPRECSRCNPYLYYSARRLGIKSGRTLSAIERTR